MCLGIPGQLCEFDPDNPYLADIEVAGVRRKVNIGLLADGEVTTGDWVLIHVGFAMSRIDEDEAARALEGLQLMGQDYDDELAALKESRIE